jgi:hypothetical protein
MTREMSETAPQERELKESPAEDIKFVEGAADEMSDVLSKYAIVPTPDAFLLQEEDLASKTDEQIAEMLENVDVVDPTFEPKNIETDTDQGLFNVGVLASAKAKRVAAEMEDKDAKRKLQEWSDRVLGGFASTIAGIGGKKATGIALSGILSIGMSACGVSGMAGANPGSIPTETGPRVTQTTETPIETPTQTPTEAPTPTENPNAVSSDELLANCPVKLEIDAPLKGKSFLPDGDINLNYPNLNIHITIGLDQSLIDRGKDPNSQTAKFKWLPYDNIILSDSYKKETGIDPKVQAETDVWYIIYKAWQHDGDNTNYSQRKDVSFTDFLQMANDGEDVSISHWVITDKSKIYPNEEDKIDPTKLNIVMIFTDYDRENGFQYDSETNTLISIHYLTSGPGAEPDSVDARANGYMQFINRISFLALPTDLQKATAINNQDQTKLRATLEETYLYLMNGYAQRLREGKIDTFPLDSISPGFKN